MTYKEWTMIARGLCSIYTNDKFLKDDVAMHTWYELLKDLPYEQVSMAAQKYMATEHYPPTPADLRKAVTPVAEDWSDAWGQVISAVRKYGSWDVKAAEDSFEPRTAKVVRSLGGFRRICELEHDEMDITRANFRDIYTRMAASDREQATMPPRLRSMINEMLGNSGTKALNENRPCERLELANE